MRHLIILFLLFFSFVCVADQSSLINSKASDAPLNVILMIGDGMGRVQRDAATRFYLHQPAKLVMDRLLIQTQIKTDSLDGVTDSAASATAFATGIKTHNHVIGLDKEGKPRKNLTELAKEKFMSVGLVTTTQIAHATPAAFVAHVKHRKQMTTIAEQLSASDVDVLLGGGENDFLPKRESGRYEKPGHRNDARNLINTFKQKSFVYVSNKVELEKVDETKVNKLIGLFADKGMDVPHSPNLKLMTEKALAILSKNKNGFFLMAEGGQIDWAAHQNNAKQAMENTYHFDLAVGLARTFVEDNPNTLLIVTADHETGGMRVDEDEIETLKNAVEFIDKQGKSFYVSWSTKGHTGVPVPLSAMGKGAEYFSSVNDNTHVFSVIRDLWGFK